MNFLILSSGTRNKLIQYLKNELGEDGKVIATDCSNYAPTIYEADKFYIVPRINEEGYLEAILDICKKEEINAIFSLIDPELSLIAKNKKIFESMGINVFVSDYKVVETCFDKYSMYKKCCELKVPTVLSFHELNEFKKAYLEKKVGFPVFIKPNKGSCSVDIKKINTLEKLEYALEKNDDLIIQEYMDGDEFGVDAYIDIISGDIVSIFIKKKLLMRGGETDKAVSVKNNDLFELINEFVKKMGFKGQIDIDVFVKDGKFFISEVNPRFGGGYPHAYECGCNFFKYMVNNVKGIINKPEVGFYNENIYMMKYSEVMIKKDIGD